MIEPGTACQLECPHCPTGRNELNRSAGRLSVDNFKKIWDSIKPAPIRLQLWNQGEPLTNPDTPEIIRHAASTGSWVVLSTNVELLEKRRIAEEITLSGLSELILSLDGTTGESHVAYRKGGDFQKVEKGIKNVVQIKKEHGLKSPLLTWQFIMFKHNMHEMNTAKKLARQWGVNRIVFKTAQLEDLSPEEGEKWMPDESKQRRYDLKNGEWILKRRKSFFCDRLFASAVVLWDGTVVPCCFDKDGSYPLGNSLEKPFPEIWRGEKFQQFRRNWISRDRPVMCSNCTEGLKGLYR
jgi:radical SAM protein with 4Fe4S-binding SPASM domain